MNLFKDTTFTWWQLGIFKWSVAAFGVAVGAHWSEIFAPFFPQLIGFALITSIYCAYVWAKK